MELSQNQLEQLKNKMELGQLTANQANVEIIKIERFRLITSRVSSDIRKELNAAVKRGELGHMKKEQNKPEVYYHPNFKYLANEAREKYEQKVLNAMVKMCGSFIYIVED